MGALEPRPLDTLEEQRTKHGRPVAPATIAAGVLVVDLARSTLFILVNSGNITTFTVQGASSGWPTGFTLLIESDGAANTQDWGSTLWASGTAPTLGAVAGEIDVLAFAWDGSRWFGFVTGQAFS